MHWGAIALAQLALAIFPVRRDPNLSNYFKGIVSGFGQASALFDLANRITALSATCPRESVLPIRLRPEFPVVFEGYAGWAEHWPVYQQAQKRSLWADILRS